VPFFAVLSGVVLLSERICLRHPASPPDQSDNHRDIRQEDQVVSILKIVCDQSPQHPMRHGQAYLEPAKAGADAPGLSGMGEDDNLLELKQDRVHPLEQEFRFPAVQAIVVDLHLAIVAGAAGNHQI
jgi:hypothetical protein